MHRPTPVAPLLALLALALAAPSALAESAFQQRFDARASAFRAAPRSIPVARSTPPPGAQVLTYRYGPMKIQPGQNTINIDLLQQQQRPQEDGYIVGFRPGLVYVKGGKSPSVKTVHLHHAVWLVGDSVDKLYPTYAAGEEKTYLTAPRGFGWRYTTKQFWLINHMIHNLTAQPQEVYVTYTLWFIPDSAPEAANITPVHTQWLDVEGLKPYPVFTAPRGAGRNGRFTFPTDAPNAYRNDGGRIRNRWVADHDGTMVSTAGHLHPGGLWTDLWITRDGVTKRIFRSRANYFEPVGAVSWDVAMSGTAPDWKVNFKKGDIISTTATYDTTKATWYEVMGIMVVGVTDQQVPGGVDPFTQKVDQTDYLTHGRLKENIDSGVRRPTGLRNPLRLPTGPYRDKVVIKNFVFQQGDLTLGGRRGLPPAVKQGQSLEFVNEDAPLTERYHTITACRAPCNLTGGIGYPLADATRIFDSGELGYGVTTDAGNYSADETGNVPFSPVADIPTDMSNCAAVPGIAKAIASGCIGTTVYRTPKNLKPGTYTYFCRIHPFMRGAFRVVGSRSS